MKHNPDSENQSYVYLSFRRWKDELIFQCINSLPAKAPEEHKTGGLGLKNIRRRLELLYPGRHSLEIEKK
ncbi:MAG: hypothetical protein LUE99_14670 [Bacteroides sp.]|nr:hypothetical protein [Bacteroides sp.]